MSDARKFANEAEVAEFYKQDKDNNQVVIFEGKVFDVKDYMPDHPGGPEYIADKLGTNIEEPFEDAEHTKKAKKILLNLPLVGVIDSSSGTNSTEDEQG